MAGQGFKTKEKDQYDHLQVIRMGEHKFHESPAGKGTLQAILGLACMAKYIARTVYPDLPEAILDDPKLFSTLMERLSRNAAEQYKTMQEQADSGQEDEVVLG